MDSIGCHSISAAGSSVVRKYTRGFRFNQLVAGGRPGHFGKRQMGAEKNSSDGQFSLGYGWFAGYGKGLDVTLVILPDRVKIAQRITGDFPSGNSVSGMADALANDGVATPGGKPIRSETLSEV